MEVNDNQDCMVTNILQNMFFQDPQKKDMLLTILYIGNQTVLLTKTNQKKKNKQRKSTGGKTV